MSLVNGATRWLAVIGEPITHSLSPVMHNAAIAHLGVNYVYLPLAISPEELKTAVRGLAALRNCEGFNVTIPHKIRIIPYLETITPEAALVGAVNTVWRTAQGGWQGTNTDVDGFIAPLKTLRWDWQEITPIILGNGGAARAVVVGLVSLGCREIHVVGRDSGKLEQFAESWSAENLVQKLKISTWETLPHLLKHSQLVINTTPIGMSPNFEESPLSAAMMDLLPSEAIAYDLIYNPRPTKFLQQAQARGLKTIDGLEMLVQQGAVALEKWLKQPIPVTVMTNSLIAYLNHKTANLSSI